MTAHSKHLPTSSIFQSWPLLFRLSGTLPSIQSRFSPLSCRFLTHIHYAGFIKNHGKNSRKTFSLPLFYHKKSTDRGVMSLYENNRTMQLALWWALDAICGKKWNNAHRIWTNLHMTLIIWHKAASPHRNDISVVFARWRSLCITSVSLR